MHPFLSAAVILLLTPTAALAQESTPAPPALPPPPAPAPAAGTLSLKVAGQVLAGQRIRVQGALAPAVAGQHVTVRFTRGHKTLRSVRVAVHSAGAFAVGYAPKRAGRVTVRAVHAATPQIALARAKARHVLALATAIRPGQRTASVRWLQGRLAGLRYAVSRSGTYDAATRRAVMTYRKATGMARSEVANRDVFRRLARGIGAFRVRYASDGRHVEADLSHQVLALVNPGGKVHRIYQTASGASITPTVLGHFRVYLKTPGTNAKGMVDSAYFIRGYAIHGYATVPVYPASHGCLRVPLANAAEIFNWVRIGTRVDVYAR
jgi:lipoprotein-anchoring transpeptidase ErfK/SrfK